MNETYQNRITDQICKIQNDRALIAFYDRLRYAPLGNYAQLHAKGEYQENGHKVHSLHSSGPWTLRGVSSSLQKSGNK